MVVIMVLRKIIIGFELLLQFQKKQYWLKHELINLHVNEGMRVVDSSIIQSSLENV
jgi:hypothetical protein